MRPFVSRAAVVGSALAGQNQTCRTPGCRTGADLPCQRVETVQSWVLCVSANLPELSAGSSCSPGHSWLERVNRPEHCEQARYLSTSPTTKNMEPRMETMSEMRHPGNTAASTETLLKDADRSFIRQGVLSPRDTR